VALPGQPVVHDALRCRCNGSSAALAMQSLTANLTGVTGVNSTAFLNRMGTRSTWQFFADERRQRLACRAGGDGADDVHLLIRSGVVNNQPDSVACAITRRMQY
jgi:hypothetical protein